MKRIQLIIIAILSIANILLAAMGINIEGINVGIILLALEIIYLYLSFGKVEIDEVAVLFLWGRPIKELEPGLYIALLGIFSVRKEKGTFFNDELPSEPEKIFREDGKIPDGMFPPIRIKFGMPKEDDDEILKKDPYNVSIVADVVPVVSWRINNPIYFFQKMDTISNCRSLLSDKAIATFGDDLSKMTPAKALLNLKEISRNLEEEVKKSTKDWGIEIKDAYLKPFNFSHALNDSVVNVVKAGQKSQETRITADAEEYKKKREGAGIAEAKRLLLEAEAIGLAKLAKISKTDEGKATLWMKTLSDAFEKAEYSIIPGGELFTSIAGIKEMLDKVKGGKLWMQRG